MAEEAGGAIEYALSVSSVSGAPVSPRMQRCYGVAKRSTDNVSFPSYGEPISNDTDNGY